ncbi:MAG: UbiX family flavin prenyltransferase [Campylobacter sp.]|nr:UbiX family flavin prenyltransferase [Campylobacter sp.]
MKKVILAISGASGVWLGFKMLYELAKSCETHCIISQNAKIVLKHEKGIDFENFMQNKNLLNSNPTSLQNDPNLIEILSYLSKKDNVIFYDDSEIWAPIASGSFLCDTFFITPCSLNTLAKISCGIADTLITRVAAVALKQRLNFILGVREMPFSTLVLEQMTKLSSYGVIVAPPVYGDYYQAKNIQDIQNFILGKWLDLAKIPNELYKRWQG